LVFVEVGCYVATLKEYPVPTIHKPPPTEKTEKRHDDVNNLCDAAMHQLMHRAALRYCCDVAMRSQQSEK